MKHYLSLVILNLFQVLPGRENNPEIPKQVRNDEYFGMLAK